MKHPDVIKLKRVSMEGIELTDAGKDWWKAGVAVNYERLIEFYGELTPPQAAIQDDLMLCLFWERDGDPVVIRFDPEMWDYAKDPLTQRSSNENN